MIYIALIILPFIASLQRYAVSYGYEGKTKQEAFKSAKGIFIFFCFVSAIVLMLK